MAPMSVTIYHVTAACQTVADGGVCSYRALPLDRRLPDGAGGTLAHPAGHRVRLSRRRDGVREHRLQRPAADR